MSVAQSRRTRETGTSTASSAQTPDTTPAGAGPLAAVQASNAEQQEKSAGVEPEGTPTLDAASSGSASKQAGKPKTAPKTQKKKPAAGAKTGTAEGDPVSRPDLVKKGARGALIGAGKAIGLKSAADLAGSDVTSVDDGTACSVLGTLGDAIQVQVRVGDKNVKGWVSASLFSNQPALSKDEDDEKLFDNYVFRDFGPGQEPKDPQKEIAAQGALGDCFLIASIAAITNADPDFMKGVIKYNAKTKRYDVRFFQEVAKGQFVPVVISVDGYLPVEAGSPNDPVYAGDPGQPQWGAIIEKAYAMWKGGYDVLGEGGTGEEAMTALTGVKAVPKDPSSMREQDVLPFFKDAKKKNLAIYAGVVNSVEAKEQTPLSGSSSGPYSGKLDQMHEWNQIQPGTLSITDAGRQVASAKDQGEEEAKEGKITGTDVKSGSVQYKENTLALTYKAGKAPKRGSDLQVAFETHGVVLPAKMLIGNHAYAFDKVVGDQLQFYNPWGSYQPKPITAAEFLTYFDSLSTASVPKNKTT